MVLVLGARGQAQATRQEIATVRVTHYLYTGSPMASGDWPFVGAVACSYNWPLYTWFITPDGAWWQCLDRGNLGWSGWLDFYGFDAEAAYGPWTDVEVVY